MGSGRGTSRRTKANAVIAPAPESALADAAQELLALLDGPLYGLPAVFMDACHRFSAVAQEVAQTHRPVTAPARVAAYGLQCIQVHEKYAQEIRAKNKQKVITIEDNEYLDSLTTRVEEAREGLRSSLSELLRSQRRMRKTKLKLKPVVF